MDRYRIPFERGPTHLAYKSKITSNDEPSEQIRPIYLLKTMPGRYKDSPVLN